MSSLSWNPKPADVSHLVHVDYQYHGKYYEHHTFSQDLGSNWITEFTELRFNKRIERLIFLVLLLLDKRE